ncbi:hypothetical protein COL26_13970 [Bacillus thuringiensis]|uniref:Uncharacterized protein n=1 Tax=Bacillus thuringiensis TaxID=1428 RepID=A0ABD6RT17_BACTU|nr:hypothetical protein [Bacillus thuringiensis]ANN34894.1 hypothetical protein A9498_26735 [Bacillus thuringiensis serovar coreanensis]PER33564.1 hypothetical protein CN495_36365 [Bacillus thuringiensis]PEU74595.1 hypothetical protein CN411_31640 [Bacillus thuringiensis]PFH98702.1 hypothetical protein COI79_33340 [Bacillus thuringiensis]PFW42149.1 hypothetical protein COL26_13970 [Bacillus thuringiensis]
MRRKNEEYERNKIKERLQEEVRKGAQNKAQIIKNIQDIQQSTMELISAIQQPVIDIHDSLVENMYVFSEMNQHIAGLMNSIDWETINQELEDDARNIEGILKEYEKDFWCVDMELFALIEDKELKFKEAPKYIEENLGKYISEINNESLYKFHTTLINEAYEAYKAGLYKLCTFPLFATFEYVMTSWYKGTINEDKQSIRQTKYVKGLRSNVHPKNYKNVEEDPMFKVFSFSVIRVYRKLFDTKYTNSKLNRNTIAHGFHNYDSISKNDVLKLFQILKAAPVLKVFDKSKLPIKKVAES